jgi:hypothetical protein
MATTLFLGDAASVQGQVMTIPAGRKLNIIDAPTDGTNIANKSYVDLKAKEVQDALNLVTAGSNVSFDTLLELKNLADDVRSTGATNLSTAIATEKSRAEGVEATLTSAISTETSVARAAESVLTSTLSTETSVARAAELVLRTDLASEVSAARAAELRLQTMNILSSTPMLYVPAVYADSSSLPTPLERCTYAATVPAGNFDGWRMRNAVQGNKFNFYVPSTGLKVGDIKAMYLEACAPSVVSMPFLTIYTIKKFNNAVNTYPGSVYPEGEGSWYRSKATYIRNDTDVLVAGSKYNMVANLKSISNIYLSNYFTQHNLILDTFSSRNVANMGDNDDILFFAISSDSSSSAGNMECIISKFKVQLEAGIHEFVFSNSDVFADYMKRKQSQLWNALYGTSSTDDPFINDYQIPARTYS